MSDIPDYQSVLDHMRARRDQLDAAIVAMEAMLGALPAASAPKAYTPATTVSYAPTVPAATTVITGLPPRPLPALTESAIRAALNAGADTVAAVATRTKLHPEKVKLALRAMRERGLVTKTGATASTRYHLA